MDTTLNNLHLGSPVLTEYDFRAATFYDGYMSLTRMAKRIQYDIDFEKKLQKSYEDKLAKKGQKNEKI